MGERKCLKEYSKLCKEINYLNWSINKIKGQLNRNGIRALLNETISMESEDTLTKELESLQQQLKEHERLELFYKEIFDSIKDETDIEIVRLSIEGHSLKSIADNLYFSYGYVRTRSRCLLNNINFIIDCRQIE